MVACTRSRTCTLSINDRLALEEMAKLVSLHLQNLLGLIVQHTRSGLREQLSNLQGTLSSSNDIAKRVLSRNLTSIRGLFNATGAWLRFQGEDAFAGMVPDRASVAPLRDWLDSWSREMITYQETLPAALSGYPALAGACQRRALHSARQRQLHLAVACRDGRTVNWGRRPAELSEDANDLAPVLAPRHSFSVWAQQVRNTSEPWSDAEIEFAETLRIELLKYISIAQLEQWPMIRSPAWRIGICFLVDFSRKFVSH